MSKPFRILQICHKPPRPAVDGGCIAMDSLTTGMLLEGHQVKVLSLHTHKHPFKSSALDEAYLNATRFEAIYADTELNIRDAASHVITGESYHLSRFHVPEMDRTIERVLREEIFDVVVLESLFTTSYIPAIRRLSDAEIILRAHNVEHQLWQEVSAQMGGGPKKWLLNLFQRNLQHEEINLLDQVDGVAAITDQDAAWFRHAMTSNGVGNPHRVVTVPFGLDVESISHASIGVPPNHMLHLGSMDWTPNVQGVMWLMKEVWPLVRKDCPEAVLKLAGRHMPASLSSEPTEGIEVLGEVESAEKTYDTSCAVVIPLHAGSGMRIKLTEALAAGRPVVTTSKGMEGLELTNGQHVLVANTAHDMAEAIKLLLTQPTRAIELGHSGREWAMTHLGHRARARAFSLQLADWIGS